MSSHTGPSSTVIVPLSAEHADQVLATYQAGIDEGNATFETSAPSWEDFDAAKLPGHRFAALDSSSAVLGWVAATADPVRDLPREHRQPRPARARGLPHHRHPGARWAPPRVWRDVVLLERRSPAIS